MQTTPFMLSMNGTKKLFGNVRDIVPDSILGIRMRRRRTVSSFVLGAIGVAVLGGIAAVMFFSPRTRYRVLGAAKDTYGKLAQSDIGNKLGIQREAGGNAQPNGLVGSSSYGVSTGI